MDNLEQYKEYLKNIKRSLAYYNYLRPLSEYLKKNDMEFVNITKDQLAKYFSDKKYSPNAINLVIKSCRDFCRYKKIESHACFEIKLLKVKRKVIEYLTLDEIERAIKHIATNNPRLNSDKVATILYFMFFTGIRKSELLNLTRDNIDVEKCLVKIYEEKTKKEKIIPYPKRINDRIKNYFLLEAEKNNAFNITKKQINYLFRNIMTKYLGRKIKPHLTRHGGARYLGNKGVPPTIIQKILGHTNLNTTLIYLEADQKMIEEKYREQIG